MTRLRELRDPGEQLVEVEHGSDFAADFRQQFERFRVLPLAARTAARSRARWRRATRTAAESSRRARCSDRARGSECSARRSACSCGSAARPRWTPCPAPPRRSPGSVRMSPTTAACCDAMTRPTRPCAGTQLESGGVRIADRVGDAQLGPLLVQQVHGKRVELDQPARSDRESAAAARRNR